MTGKCKLCESQQQLCESHIVPKFIYRWLKSTSPTSYMRKMSNPNIRIQDGLKFHLLCKNCEDKFSNYEKKFAEKYFYPSTNADNVITQIDYSDDIFYFVISILWRFIVINIDRYEDSQYHQQLLLCESELKLFLTEFKYPLNFDKYYIMLTNYVESGPKELKGLNQFGTRTVDAQIIYDDKCCFFYLQMPFFIFIGDIHGIKEEDFINSRIHPTGGTFTSYLMKAQSTPIGAFMYNRIQAIDDMKVSDKQQQVIADAIKKNLDKVSEKQGFKALLSDFYRDYKG